MLCGGNRAWVRVGGQTSSRIRSSAQTTRIKIGDGGVFQIGDGVVCFVLY